ncbi:MAG: tetratricopeptide repeat protein [Candidatus Aminicenantales bacterium]
MFARGIKTATLVLLVVAVIFFTSDCKKFNVNTLKANYHFSKANAHFSDGLYRKAIDEYEEALRLNPKLYEAYHFLGESYKNLYRGGVETEENMDKARKALEALQKAYEYFPNDKQIIYSLGDMYDKMRNFDEAEKYFLKILELEPGNMANYYVVAEFYKRYAGGTQQEKKEGEEKPEPGTEQEAVKKKTPFQKAEEMYLRRIEADPENPQGYSYIARFYELPPLNDYDKALQYYDLLLKLAPDNAEAWLSKGVNRWAKAFRVPDISREERIKAGEEGLECLEEAIKLDPNYPDPYSWKSVIYESVLARLQPEKAARYKAEAAKARDRYQELRQRAAARERLAQELIR